MAHVQIYMSKGDRTTGCDIPQVLICVPSLAFAFPRPLAPPSLCFYWAHSLSLGLGLGQAVLGEATQRVCREMGMPSPRPAAPHPHAWSSPMPGRVPSLAVSPAWL